MKYIINEDRLVGVIKSYLDLTLKNVFYDDTRDYLGRFFQTIYRNDSKEESNGILKYRENNKTLYVGEAIMEELEKTFGDKKDSIYKGLRSWVEEGLEVEILDVEPMDVLRTLKLKKLTENRKQKMISSFINRKVGELEGPYPEAVDYNHLGEAEIWKNKDGKTIAELDNFTGELYIEISFWNAISLTFGLDDWETKKVIEDWFIDKHPNLSTDYENGINANKTRFYNEGEEL